MTIANKSVRKLLKWLFILCAFIIALLVMGILGKALFDHSSVFVGFHQFVEQHQVKFAVWRYFWMLLFILFYPSIVSFLCKRGNDARIKEKAKRWHAILICLFYEVVVVHNGLGCFLSKVFHL